MDKHATASSGRIGHGQQMAANAAMPPQPTLKGHLRTAADYLSECEGLRADISGHLFGFGEPNGLEASIELDSAVDRAEALARRLAVLAADLRAILQNV